MRLILRIGHTATFLCKITLFKGQCHEIFLPLFRDSNPSWPVIPMLIFIFAYGLQFAEAVACAICIMSPGTYSSF